MNRIERILWFLVAVVFGELGMSAYQRYIVPPKQPVKQEQKEFRRAVDTKLTISCSTQEILDDVMAAFEEGEASGWFTLLIYSALGYCSYKIEMGTPT